MDTKQASEQLEMIDGILKRADRSLNDSPVPFIMWGTFGALLDLAAQARLSGWPEKLTVVPVVWLMISIPVVIWDSVRRSGRGRQTMLDRQAQILVGVAWGVSMIASIAARVSGLLPDESHALVWSVGFSIAMLVLGFQGSRVHLAGGAALVASIVAAAFAPALFHGVLGAGMLAGIVCPGIWIAFRGR